jgi:hypothetical protein
MAMRALQGKAKEAQNSQKTRRRKQKLELQWNSRTTKCQQLMLFFVTMLTKLLLARSKGQRKTIKLKVKELVGEAAVWQLF